MIKCILHNDDHEYLAYDCCIDTCPMHGNTKELIGYKSGDNECFCWDVSKEVFIKLTGEDPEVYERLYKSIFHKNSYKVYPQDIIPELFEGKEKQKLTIKKTVENNKLIVTIEVEELVSDLNDRINWGNDDE